MSVEMSMPELRALVSSATSLRGWNKRQVVVVHH
jgi:hypothetical protein